MKKAIWLFLTVSALLLLSLVVASPVATQDERDALPLSAPGPYAVGTRDMTFTDENRDAQEIDVTLWYPAVEEAADAVPDLSGAPYPVVVYSHGGTGGIANRKDLTPLVSHLVSYGFVVAAPTHHWEDKSQALVHRPLDVLFVIDQLADLNDDGLSGLMNLEQLGVMGYSMGATTTLQMAGVRPDRAYYNTYCADHPLDTFFCLSESALEEADALNAQFSTMDENGLWYIPTDPHIRAVAAMAPCFSPLFGERGLAAADVPILMMAGTADEVCLYERDAVFMFNHLGSQDRYLIDFIGGMHTFGYDTRTANPRINHLMTAYFGYYLQGQEDYAQYLTEDYVDNIEGLAWGPYGVDELALTTEQPLFGTYTTTITQQDIEAANFEIFEDLEGTWDIQFSENGVIDWTYRANNLDREYAIHTEFSAADDTLVLGEESGEYSCDQTGVTYDWTWDGTQLALTNVDDSCTQRMIVLTSHPLVRLPETESP